MVSARSLAGLMGWLRREEWQGPFNDLLKHHVGMACTKAGVSVEQLPDLLGDHVSVLWGCVFEDFLTCELEDGRNIVDDYLKRRGWKEGPSNKAYITALRSSVMSLYEVSDIVRDESFLARDLVRGGEPLRVSERSGTRYLKQWDRIAARVVRVGSRVEMAGGALPFDHETSEALLKTLGGAGGSRRSRAGKSARKPERTADNAPDAGPSSNIAIRHAAASLFTSTWLDDLLQRTLHPTLPEMLNADGDEIVFTTLRYLLRPTASVDAVALALASIPALRPEGKSFWNWIAPKTRAAARRGKGHALITALDDGSLVLGTVELKDRTLIIEANSQRRAEQGRTLMEPVLGELVGEPQIETRTVDQMMTSPPTRSPAALSSGLSPAEERALVQGSLNRHYASLLDQPIPMLGNVSPLKAAESAKGRERLVAWLKLLENHAAKQKAGDPMADYDFSWMWKKLGVAELRR